jgi:very-short-patch-repair endonuclease/DNA polymerase III delta prime subunit
MQDTILSRLEAARKELLDLGLRNPLINYKGSKAKGLHIVQEKPAAVYDLLVNQEKAFSFVPVPEKKETLHDGANEEENQFYTDTKLQTAEIDSSLQHKLLNTFYAARTSLEEQGINTLFLTLGMLQWYEADASQEARLAPLILIPVTLERSTARERFRLRYSLEEIGHNLSLQAKLKAEFGIEIPDLPDEDDVSIETYFASVAEAVDRQKRWTVMEDAIELGFFSFGKFMIYHDLDNDKWPEEEKPTAHPILQSLFGAGFRDTQPVANDNAFIDQETNAHELFQVVDADSSQILAMLAVHEGRNLVIQGPPGTGKSQTITNMIANAIGQGKKVLFVAEKMAALEVVKRRMDNIGLGEACLELHSHKANKKELHQELKRILELGKPAVQKLQEEVALLDKHKEEINAYCLAVNATIGNSHLTAHNIFGYLLKISERIANHTLPKIHLPKIQHWNDDKQQRAEAMAERIEARLKDIGVPSELLFWGVGLRVLLPQDTVVLKETMLAATAAVEKLAIVGKEVTEAVGVMAPANREEAMKLAAMVQLASIKPDLQNLALYNKAWLEQKAALDELLQAGERLTQLHQEYAEIFLPEAWEIDALTIRQELKENGEKWHRFLIGSYKRAVKQLRAVCKANLPKDNSTRLQYAEAILDAKRLTAMLKEHEALAGELFGSRWQNRRSDWPALNEATAYLQTVHQQILEKTCPAAILDYLFRHESSEVAKSFYQKLLTALNEHGKAIHHLVEGLQLNENLRFSGTFLHQAFSIQQQQLTVWLEGLSELQLAVSWNNLADIAKEEDLTCLIDASISWKEAKDFLKLALQKTWYEYLLEIAMSGFPALRKFERTSHEEVIKQFRRLDVLSLQYNRAKAALKHWETLPTIEAGGQMSVLKTEFNRKARHLPIRKLMQEAGLAIQAIKPVFMMSPLSIANFLSPGALEFDLVIFDEASQVRPVDALGALLRGKQLVVVGDSKQLPPTSFFDTMSDNVDDEENVTADMESILGMCDAQGASQRMLRWHYRSRHESLIRLSNHEFYENKLVVFPSPGSKTQMGIIFHHLVDTVYDRGGTRTNPKEAEIVAQAVMEHARHHPRQSLGVVAFSTAQREAIQDALEQKRKETPDLEDFFKTSKEEPFFVKNLENVQGDERDVMFISIGYGRTKEGYVSMSFGPLNNDGGEKRLNVLITRAKQRCEVFTNITAADITTERTASRGVQALKSFLHYAQHGTLHLPTETDREADSPFEEMVALALERQGYTVRKQVGSQGFYLDLAIVDLAHPGRYLLGIECDGAAYHSARSARDRDRLRQQVLEGMGWRIHRIWSTDWFRHPERELKRVVEAIEKAKLSAHLIDEAEEVITVDGGIVREQQSDEEVPQYQLAVLPKEIATKELQQHSIGKLAGWIEAIVKTESPVHFDEVARRMAEAAGVTRVGTRMKSQLSLAAKFAEGGGKIKLKGEFLWDPAMHEPQIRNRSSLSSVSKKFRYIAPEELVSGVEKVVREAIAISPEAAVSYVAKLFGFARVTEEMREDILAVINEALSRQSLQREGELLKVAGKVPA